MNSNRESKSRARAPKKTFYKLPDGFTELSKKDQDAWITEVAEDLASREDRNYEVTVLGAGLFGTAYGKKTFEETLTYLNEIHVRRGLKCRPNWCRPCSLYKLKLDQGLTYHVLQISKANAKKIVNQGTFYWEWSKSESEFAKSKSNQSPAEYWSHLSESRSKPVFYTRIMSEKYAEYLLGSRMKP